MNAEYLFTQDIINEVEIPSDGILTRALANDAAVKTVLFAFSTGQELSQHTASMPAILYFVQGEATLTLGQDVFEVQAGSIAHLPPNLEHSITAKTPTIMLLHLLKGPAK